MNSTIFIPKIIRVGSVERTGTYTNKLSYVIYYDSKNKLRKEASWESWRNKEIEPENFDNIPTEGFVLNKRAGGYDTGWNHRNTYCRIYDPRGFEFEITIENLLYILENTNSIKGKGLEGSFVYGWSSSDLILIPTLAPEYVEISNFTNMINKPESIKGKDLVFGGRYKNNQNEELTYLGRFDIYNYGTNKGLVYWFCKKSLNWKNEPYNQVIHLSSLSGRIIQTISTEPVDNYADLMEEIQHRQDYSPIDENATEYEKCDLEYIRSNCKSYYNIFHIFDSNRWIEVTLRQNYSNSLYKLEDRHYNRIHLNYSIKNESTLEELFEKIDFYVIKQKYLKNGKTLIN